VPKHLPFACLPVNAIIKANAGHCRYFFSKTRQNKQAFPKPVIRDNREDYPFIAGKPDNHHCKPDTT